MSIVGSERENDEYGRYFDRMSPVTLLQDYRLAKDDVLTERMKKFPVSSTEYGGFYIPGSPVPDPPRPFFSRSHSRLYIGKTHRLHAPYNSPGSIEHKWKPPRDSRLSPPPPYSNPPLRPRRDTQYTHRSEPDYRRLRHSEPGPQRPAEAPRPPAAPRQVDDYRRRDGDFRLPSNLRPADYSTHYEPYREVQYRDSPRYSDHDSYYRDDWTRYRYDDDRYDTVPIRDLDEDDPRRRHYHEHTRPSDRRYRVPQRTRSVDAADEIERRGRDHDYWDRYRAYRSGYERFPEIRTDLAPYNRHEDYPRVPASYLY